MKLEIKTTKDIKSYNLVTNCSRTDMKRDNKQWVSVESMKEELNKIDVFNINAYHELNKLKEELEQSK
jgi:hypothetical protein